MNHADPMDPLSIDGLSLRIDRQTMSAPVICPDAPHTRVLNWVTEQVRTLSERVERRAGAYAPPQFAAEPLAVGAISAADRERWRALTGAELGDDVYRLSAFDLEPFVLPRSTLRAIIRRLEELQREAEPLPGPWLFRRRPLRPLASPDEEASMRALEARVAQLDELAAPPCTLERVAAASTLRPLLLADLEARGILSDEHAAPMLAALALWELPALAACKRAAIELTAYFDSASRRSRLPEADHRQPILGSRVSIDWMRRPQPAPPGLTPFEWLARCEHALLVAGEPDGQEGALVVHTAGATAAVYWRRDVGVHAAVWRTAPSGAESQEDVDP